MDNQQSAFVSVDTSTWQSERIKMHSTTINIIKSHYLLIDGFACGWFACYWSYRLLNWVYDKRANWLTLRRQTAKVDWYEKTHWTNVALDSCNTGFIARVDVNMAHDLLTFGAVPAKRETGKFLYELYRVERIMQGWEEFKWESLSVPQQLVWKRLTEVLISLNMKVTNDWSN